MRACVPDSSGGRLPAETTLAWLAKRHGGKSHYTGVGWIDVLAWAAELKSELDRKPRAQEIAYPGPAVRTQDSRIPVASSTSSISNLLKLVAVQGDSPMR